MSYCTRYSIFKEEGKQEWKNSNTSCFAEFTSTAFNSLFDFDKKSDKYIEVYVQKNNKCNGIPDDIESEEKKELIEWWTNELIKLGMPIQLELRKMKRDNLTSYNKNSNLPLDDYYVWILKFNDYKNKAHLKFALYFIRYLYEENEWEILQASKNYQKNNPKASGFEIFQFMHMFIYVSGHSFSNYLPINAMSIKEFNELVDTWDKYTDKERYTFIAKIQKHKIFPDNIKIGDIGRLGFFKDMKWKD